MSGIRIELLSGPYAPHVYEPEDDATPMELLLPFMQNRWRWKLYCIPGTDPDDIMPWIEADATVRIMQALYDGRGIRFAGRRWQTRPADKENSMRTLDELSTELGKAGACKVFSDDPGGDLVLSLGPGLTPEEWRASAGTDQSG
jgi:hypothetical protein